MPSMHSLISVRTVCALRVWGQLVPRQLDRDEKARAWREDTPYPHTGAWVGDVYEMAYEPRHAAEMDLF